MAASPGLDVRRLGSDGGESSEACREGVEGAVRSIWASSKSLEGGVGGDGSGSVAGVVDSFGAGAEVSGSMTGVVGSFGAGAESAGSGSGLGS